MVNPRSLTAYDGGCLLLQHFHDSECAMRRVVDHGFRFVGKPGHEKSFGLDELDPTRRIVDYPHVVFR